jgi:hypothetical protein
LDKCDKVHVQRVANLDRFKYVKPPLSKFVFAHIALGLTQSVGECHLGYTVLKAKLSKQLQKEPIRTIIGRLRHG